MKIIKTQNQASLLPSTISHSREPLASLGSASTNRDIKRSTDVAASKKGPTSSKRNHDDIENDSNTADGWDAEVEDLLVIENCDTIRGLINAGIKSGEVKVTHFRRNSEWRFMKLKDPLDGIDNQTYPTAFLFVRDRQPQGKMAVPAKKVKADAAAQRLDVAGIQLDGEESDSVEIYDTCDDVRRKIAAVLREPDVTGAAFLRAIGSMFHPPRRIQYSQLTSFRDKKGPLAGNTSAVFYGAYVFFEKRRIKEKKPKSQKRRDMEDIWDMDGGVNTTELSSNVRYFCFMGQQVALDEYGKTFMVDG